MFLDYENLAIGARESLGGARFDLQPISDALAERGRVVARRAYADWSLFEEDRRMLTRGHVELIEIPQRMGLARKNAADIKLAVDALELAFERDYVTTFVICSGDSDFTPLVHKLRELNKRVIGVGIKESTSPLLPAACDEFLFYERLEGVEAATTAEDQQEPAATEASPAAQEEAGDLDDLAVLITKTVVGLQRTSDGSVLASSLKRALLRKDSTFNEAEYGFRAFGEVLRHLADKGLVELSEGPARGDPWVSLPEEGSAEKEAFELLRAVVADRSNGPVYLSSLKNQLQKASPGFSEKQYGYSGFLQFCKAAQTRGLIGLEWNPSSGDYVVTVPG